jgi:transmembrane sensor
MSLCLLFASAACLASDADRSGMQQYRTETGELRTIPLPDGSTIILDVESELRVALLDEARNVYLDEGRAYFHVAYDPMRVFTVHVNRSTVQATGSQFDVRRKAGLTIVSVIEGGVHVVSTAGDANVTPASRGRRPMGKRVTIELDGVISPPVDSELLHITSWQKRRLAFQHNTLVEIADEFNRYNKSPKLRVEGDILRAKTLSGVLDADDPQSLLDYLAVDSRIEFDRADPDLIVIRMRSRYGFAKAMR